MGYLEAWTGVLDKVTVHAKENQSNVNIGRRPGMVAKSVDKRSSEKGVSKLLVFPIVCFYLTGVVLVLGGVELFQNALALFEVERFQDS